MRPEASRSIRNYCSFCAAMYRTAAMPAIDRGASARRKRSCSTTLLRRRRLPGLDFSSSAVAGGIRSLRLALGWSAAFFCWVPCLIRRNRAQPADARRRRLRSDAVPVPIRRDPRAFAAAPHASSMQRDTGRAVQRSTRSADPRGHFKNGTARTSDGSVLRVTGMFRRGRSSEGLQIVQFSWSREFSSTRCCDVHGARQALALAEPG